MRTATTEDGRVVIARIPKGQSLELVAAVAAYFGAVLPDALMSQGDDFGTAADITTSADTSEGDVVRALRRATRKLAEGLPAPKLCDEPDEVLADDPMVLNQLRATEDGGVEFGIGGATEAARHLAGQLLAVFLPAIEEQGAENYLTWDAFVPDSREKFSVIFVKPGGLTPHEARQIAEEKLAEALERLDAIEGNAAAGTAPATVVQLVTPSAVEAPPAPDPLNGTATAWDELFDHLIYLLETGETRVLRKRLFEYARATVGLQLPTVFAAPDNSPGGNRA